MTKHSAEPQLTIRLEHTQQGTVAPCVLLQVLPNHTLITQVISRMRRPYYLIMQHSREASPEGSTFPMAVQLIPVHTPYGYIRLAPPGPSCIAVYVIDISSRVNRQVLSSMRRTIRDIRRDFDVSDTVAHQEVTTIASLHPEPPSPWQRIVIHRYFDNLAKNTCAVRAQLALSCLLELFVQVAGVAVRALSVLGVLIFLRRNIAWSALGDIRVSAVWTESGSSPLACDRDGNEREWWLLVESVYTTMLFWIICGLLWLTSILLAPFILLCELCIVRGGDVIAVMSDTARPYSYADFALGCRNRDVNVDQVTWEHVSRKTIALQLQRFKAHMCRQYA